MSCARSRRVPSSWVSVVVRVSGCVGQDVSAGCSCHVSRQTAELACLIRCEGPGLFKPPGWLYVRLIVRRPCINPVSAPPSWFFSIVKVVSAPKPLSWFDSSLSRTRQRRYLGLQAPELVFAIVQVVSAPKPLSWFDRSSASLGHGSGDISAFKPPSWFLPLSRSSQHLSR